MFFTVSRLVLLIVALSVDAFAAGLSYGADKVRIPPLSALIVAFLSDLLLIASLLAGSLFKALIPPSLAALFSFALLFILGVLKIFDSSVKKIIRENRFKDRELHLSLKNLGFILTVYAQPQKANTEDIEVLSPGEAVSLGLALSLDSIAAGIGAASSELSLPLTALLTFSISLLSVFAGCRLGRFLADRSGLNLSVMGGILLVLLAFAKLC